MDEEPIVFRVDWQRDPEGRLLHACLEAHFAGMRAHERVRLVVRLWVAASILVWVAAVSRSFPPAAWRAPVLVAWALLAAAALGFRLGERYWLRRLADALAELEPDEAERTR